GPVRRADGYRSSRRPAALPALSATRRASLGRSITSCPRSASQRRWECSSLNLGNAVARRTWVRRDEAFPVALAAYGPSTWKGETNPSGFRSTNTAGEKMFVNGAVVRQHQPAGDESGVPPPLVHASEDCRMPQELTAGDAVGLLQ